MLIEERDRLRRVLPELAERLADSTLLSLEAAGSAKLSQWFREYGRPGMLVPTALGGDGRSLSDVAPLFRAIGAACPSLSIMMLMHHHTVGALCFDDIPLPCIDSMLQSVAQGQRLVASAFAESRPGVDLLDSSVSCAARDGGYVLNGYKKPCTMSAVADFFLVGVAGGQGDLKSRGLAIVDRSRCRVSVESFWSHETFKSTNSDCIRFEDTMLTAQEVLLPSGQGSHLMRHRFAVTQSEVTLSAVFQLLMSAAYLGMATRLCELGLLEGSPARDEQLYLACVIDAACMAQYQLAARLDQGNFSSMLLGQAMAASYNAVRRIDELLAHASAHTALLESEESSYLLKACQFVHRHPPSKAVRKQVLENCYQTM